MNPLIKDDIVSRIQELAAMFEAAAVSDENTEEAFSALLSKIHSEPLGPDSGKN